MENPENLLLIILVHGNHGFASDWNITETCIRSLKLDHKFQHIEIRRSSINEFLSTHDGIDVCGERLVIEITGWLNEVQKNKINVKVHLTVISHSLGGLISKYALGILHEKEDKPLENITLQSYVALNTPFLGVRIHKDVWWRRPIQHFLLRRTHGRTGYQLLQEDEEQILHTMSDLKHPSMIVLKKFNNRFIVSTNNDFIVSHVSACLQDDNKNETEYDERILNNLRQLQWNWIKVSVDCVLPSIFAHTITLAKRQYDVDMATRCINILTPKWFDSN